MSRFFPNSEVGEHQENDVRDVHGEAVRGGMVPECYCGAVNSAPRVSGGTAQRRLTKR